MPVSLCSRLRNKIDLLDLYNLLNKSNTFNLNFIILIQTFWHVRLNVK